MPKLISMCGAYDNKDVVSRLIYYCYNSKFAMHNYVDGSALLISTIPDVIYQIQTVQNFYNKADGKTMAHFVISFNDKSSRSLTLICDDVYHISNIISDYIGIRFQNIFFVHLGSELKDINPIYKRMYEPEINENNLHVHFAVNRVSYLDGSKYNENLNNYYDILRVVREIIPNRLGHEYNNLVWNYIYKNVFLDDDF